MNEPTLKPQRKPRAVFGVISIFCVCAAGLTFLIWYSWMTKHKQAFSLVVDPAQFAEGLGSFDGEHAAFLGWALGLIFAVIGLVRSERPRWPAFTGLVLWMLPLAVFVFIR